MNYNYSECRFACDRSKFLFFADTRRHREWDTSAYDLQLMAIQSSCMQRWFAMAEGLVNLKYIIKMHFIIHKCVHSDWSESDLWSHGRQLISIRWMDGLCSIIIIFLGLSVLGRTSACPLTEYANAWNTTTIARHWLLVDAIHHWTKSSCCHFANHHRSDVDFSLSIFFFVQHRQHREQVNGMQCFEYAYSLQMDRCHEHMYVSQLCAHRSYRTMVCVSASLHLQSRTHVQ